MENWSPCVARLRWILDSSKPGVAKVHTARHSNPSRHPFKSGCDRSIGRQRTWRHGVLQGQQRGPKEQKESMHALAGNRDTLSSLSFVPCTLQLRAGATREAHHTCGIMSEKDHLGNAPLVSRGGGPARSRSLNLADSFWP